MKRYDIIGLTLAAVCAAFAAYFLIGGSMRRVKELTREQREVSSKLNYLTALTNALGEAEGVLQQLETEIAKLDQHLPGTVGAEDFYLLLSDIAGEAGVSVNHMEPGRLEEGEGYLKLPVTISGTATFPQIHGFLFSLGALPRLTKLEHLSIEVTREPDVCTLEMILNIYAKTKRVAHDGV